MDRRIAQVLYDLQRPTKRKSYSTEKIEHVRRLERARAKRYRARKRAKADAYRAETGQNVPRPPWWFTRSRRFPTYEAYRAWKQGKPWPIPSRSALWRPPVPKEYWGKPDMEARFVRLYRSLYFDRVLAKGGRLPAYFQGGAWNPRRRPVRVTSLYKQAKRREEPKGGRPIEPDGDVPLDPSERPKLELAMSRKRSSASEASSSTPAKDPETVRADQILLARIAHIRSQTDFCRPDPAPSVGNHLEKFLKTKRAQQILKAQPAATPAIDPKTVPLARDITFQAILAEKRRLWAIKLSPNGGSNA